MRRGRVWNGMECWVLVSVGTGKRADEEEKSAKKWQRRGRKTGYQRKERYWA